MVRHSCTDTLTVSRPAALVMAVIAALSLTACSREPAARNAPAPRPTPQPAPIAESRKAFAAEQARIAAEQAEWKKLEAHRRSFVAVRFVEFDKRGRVVVALTNTTQKDIETVRGGIHAVDTAGNNLAGSGLTIHVPGQVFLAAGQSRKHAPFMSPRPELNKLLQADPKRVVFSFAAREIIYADGTKEPGLAK